MDGVNGKVSAATIKKEVVSFHAVWNWGVPFQLLEGSFPYKGLRYPKMNERAPFMTWVEIVQYGGEEYWECLYSQTEELTELLDFVKAKAAHPFIVCSCVAGPRCRLK